MGGSIKNSVLYVNEIFTDINPRDIGTTHSVYIGKKAAMIEQARKRLADWKTIFLVSGLSKSFISSSVFKFLILCWVTTRRNR
jgi:hypothetical protein